MLSPGSGFSVSVEIDFESALVARQKLQVNLVNGTFRSEIARARTFGFDHEVEQLRAMGLARGGSLDNAVVVSGDRVLNADGLRYSDEFVRHKVLDSIGDLYLAGGVDRRPFLRLPLRPFAEQRPPAQPVRRGRCLAAGQRREPRRDRRRHGPARRGGRLAGLIQPAFPRDSGARGGFRRGSCTSPATC